MNILNKEEVILFFFLINSLFNNMQITFKKRKTDLSVYKVKSINELFWCKSYQIFYLILLQFFTERCLLLWKFEETLFFKIYFNIIIFKKQVT